MDHLTLLKNFLDGENRLKAFPSKRKLQLCAVSYLAEKFEPGKIYTEREVNDLLNQWHTFHDPETLRRELFQNHYLDRRRDGSAYWLEAPVNTKQECEHHKEDITMNKYLDVAPEVAEALAAGKPVVVLMTMANTTCMVFSEVEPLADAILVGYADVKDEAYLRTVTGEHEPNGLLIAQMPASMEAVEAQTGEDVPRDVECYVDADGNVYDFAFGLNWSGKIDDQRVKTYSAEPLTECATIDFKYANQ